VLQHRAHVPHNFFMGSETGTGCCGGLAQSPCILCSPLAWLLIALLCVGITLSACPTLGFAGRGSQLAPPLSLRGGAWDRELTWAGPVPAL